MEEKTGKHAKQGKDTLNDDQIRALYQQMLEKNQQQEEDQKKKKKKRMLVILLLLLLLLGLGSCAAWFANQNGPDYEHATYGQFDNLSEEEKQRKLNELQAKAMMDISCSSMMQVESGSDQCLAKIQNKNTEESGHPWDQKITITLLNQDGSDDRVLYESNLLRPGQIMEYVTLNEVLPDGSYEVNVRFEGYNVETHEKSGANTVKVRLTVG